MYRDQVSLPLELLVIISNIQCQTTGKKKNKKKKRFLAKFFKKQHIHLPNI